MDDNSLQIISNWQNGARLWNLETAEVLRSFSADSEVVHVELSADQRWIIATTRDNRLIQWDFATGEQIRTIDLGVRSNFVKAVPDSNYVVTAYSSNTIALWDLETGQLIKEFMGHSKTVKTVDISSTGDVMISGGDDANLIVWDMATGKAINTQSWHLTSIKQVDISADNQHYISVSTDDEISLWRVEPLSNQEVEDFIAKNRITTEVSLADCLQYGIKYICYDEGIGT